jgi:hypothetical protein
MWKRLDEDLQVAQTHWMKPSQHQAAVNLDQQPEQLLKEDGLRGHRSLEREPSLGAVWVAKAGGYLPWRIQEVHSPLGA